MVDDQRRARRRHPRPGRRRHASAATQYSGIGGAEDFRPGPASRLEQRALLCLPSTVDGRRRAALAHRPVVRGRRRRHDAAPPGRRRRHRVRRGRARGPRPSASAARRWPRSPTPTSATGCSRPPSAPPRAARPCRRADSPAAAARAVWSLRWGDVPPLPAASCSLLFARRACTADEGAEEAAGGPPPVATSAAPTAAPICGPRTTLWLCRPAPGCRTTRARAGSTPPSSTAATGWSASRPRPTPPLGGLLLRLPDRLPGDGAERAAGGGPRISSRSPGP